MEELSVKTSKTILVADDESIVRALITNFLNKLGYQVETAEDGGSALERFRAMKPAPKVIVTDIVMPVMDGIALVKELRKEHPELCVLFISSHESEKFEDFDLTKSINSFLSKPFSLRDFASSISELAEYAESLVEGA